MGRFDEIGKPDFITIMDKTVLDDGNCYSVCVPCANGSFRVFGDVDEKYLFNWLRKKKVRITNASVVTRDGKSFLRLRVKVPTKIIKGMTTTAYSKADVRSKRAALLNSAKRRAAGC